jgi:hypothetical protein
MLIKISQEKEDVTVCSFIDNTTNFELIDDIEMKGRLGDARFSFPFENIEYDKAIVPKLWTILGTAATKMVDHESPCALHITAETKECISTLYSWLVSSYAAGHKHVQVPAGPFVP